MKALSLALLACCAVGALAARDPLPDFSVLANEPLSASGAAAPRFAEVDCGTDCGNQAISFTDSSSSSSSLSLGDDSDSEFDAQIESIQNELKKLDEQMKEADECSNRLKEIKSEVRTLRDQRSHIEREKEKKKLQDKLEKQMRDLSEINRMSRALRLKFSELKHAQKLIKTTMMGTRGSLNALDMEPEMDASDMQEAADNIGQEVEAMHTAQSATLARSQKEQEKDVKQSVEVANEGQLKAENDQDLFAD